jgi:hypothetical protein
MVDDRDFPPVRTTDEITISAWAKGDRVFLEFSCGEGPIEGFALLPSEARELAHLLLAKAG